MPVINPDEEDRPLSPKHYLLLRVGPEKGLVRRYKSLEMNPHNEVEEMLVIFEAVGILVGFEFMIGSMGEFYE